MKKRIFVGILLVIAISSALIADLYLAPWYPFLFLICLSGGFLATRELLELFKNSAVTPSRNLLLLAVSTILFSNWIPHFNLLPPAFHSWQITGSTAIAFYFVLILIEMFKYRSPGFSTNNLSLSAFVIVYLGLLPSFLIQLRWIGSGTSPYIGLFCLGITITVTKCCDIGAYFTGKMFGKHLMTPVLSPKKTWEGFSGGILFSVAIAFLWTKIFPNTPLCCDLASIAFGVIIGIGGVFADLVESLIKRDLSTKDASQVIPGFGGILDLLDSLLIIGPIAWLFFLN
jgi:phosphatidate cytidylyltransferase